MPGTRPHTVKRVDLEGVGKVGDRLKVDSVGGAAAGYTVAFDEGATYLYVGKAVPGSGKASALWQIKKMIIDGDDVTDIQWADGNDDFDNVWDNRTSYSYS